MTLSERNISRWLFLSLIIIFMVQSPDWAYVTTGISLCGLFGWCVYKINQSKDSVFHLNWISGFSVLIFSYLLASLFWSQIPGVSLFSLGLYIILPMIILAYSFSEAVFLDFNFLYKGLSFIGVLLSIYAMYQAFVGGGTFENVANFPFANPNSLAVILGICGLCCLGLVIDGNNKWWFATALVFIMIGLVLTHSRSGILMFSLASVFLVFAQYLAKNISLKKSLTCVLMIFGALIILPYGIDVVINHERSIVQSFDFSSPANTRIVIWESTLKAIFENHFWFGNGIGTFPHIYSGFRDMADNTYGNHAHNDVLHLWLEIGLVGVLILTPLVIGVLVVIYKIVSSAKEHFNKILPLSIIAFMGGMAMVTPIILLHVFLFIGAIMFVQVMDVLKSRRIGSKALPQVAIILVVLCAFGSLSGMMQIYAADKTKTAMTEGNLNIALKNIDTVDMLSTSLNPNVPLMRAQILQGIIDNGLLEKNAIDDAFLEMQTYIQNAKNLNPYNEEIYFTEGQLFLLMGDRLQAIDSFKKSVSLEPKHIKARLSLVDLMDNVDEKLRVLREGIGYRYINRDPKQLYIISIANAKRHNDQDLLGVASDAMRAEMRLK